MADKPPFQPPDAIGHITNADGKTLQSQINARLPTCSCTKVSNMQMFHEMKQEFATVPDPIVWQYVTDNCHDRRKCVLGLKKEAESHPGSAQAYPQALRNNSKKPQRPLQVLSNNLSSSNESVEQPKSEVSLLSDSRSNMHANDIDRLLPKVNVPERPNTLNISKLSESYQQLHLRPTRSAPPPPTASNPFFPQTPKVPEGESVNVSLNVTVSPSRPPVRPQRSVRHTTAISVQPEAPPFNRDVQHSPRSFTSVNFTLRQPTSTPQSPIDISASPSPSLTYSSSSYDARKGYTNRLEITVGSGGSSISASRIRPTSFNTHADGNDSSYSSNSSNVDEGKRKPTIYVLLFALVSQVQGSSNHFVVCFALKKMLRFINRTFFLRMKTGIPKKFMKKKKLCPHNANSLRMTSLRECENNLQPKGKQNHFFSLVFELGYKLFISQMRNFVVAVVVSCRLVSACRVVKSREYRQSTAKHEVQIFRI